MRSRSAVRNLVLLGGGRTHVHVLKSLGLRPVPGLGITLIARDADTPYSGMLPGFIAGHYTHAQCHIDLRPLARFAGARLIHDEAIGLDTAERRVSCRVHAPVAYDIVSIDIGSPRRFRWDGSIVLMNEEHTIVEARDVAVGDRVFLMPQHACTTAYLYDRALVRTSQGHWQEREQLGSAR